jgi:hypothetical protein
VETLLTCALLRVGDGAFLNHGAHSLNIRRVDFVGHRVQFDDDAVALVPVNDSVVPVGTRPGEQALLTVFATMQLLVVNDENAPATREADERRLDSFGLFGAVALLYEQGLERRAAWGTGACVLTNQRVIGLLFDDDVDGRPESAETRAMPAAAVADDSSTTVLFSVDRTQFDDREAMAGADRVSRYFHNRVPTVNLLGDNCDIVLDVFRVVDRDGRIVPPRKSVVDSVCAEFCPQKKTGGSRATQSIHDDEQPSVRLRRKRSIAWLFYAAICIACLVVAFQQPAALIGAAITGMYSVYLWRGGRFVLWIW